MRLIEYNLCCSNRSSYILHARGGCHPVGTLKRATQSDACSAANDGIRKSLDGAIVFSQICLKTIASIGECLSYEFFDPANNMITFINSNFRRFRVGALVHGR
jgi:hypothetical protein